MKFFTVIALSLFLLTLYSCQSQDPVISYAEFMRAIERKEIDKVIFHKESQTVSILHDGNERIYEYEFDDFEGKEITRALTKAKIIYKTDNK